MGHDAEISLRGEGGLIGLLGSLVVTAADPSVCTVHQRPGGDSLHRRFVITALKKGKTALVARQPTPVFSATIVAEMAVEVTGLKHGIRLVYFPGERSVTDSSGYRKDHSATVGTIYVIGGNGEKF